MGARSLARPKLKTRLVPILVGVLIILQITIPFRGWLMLLVVLGGLWVICFLWVRSLSSNLSLRREIRYGWTQVGDRLEERFILANNSRFPALWLEIQDLSNMPGYDTSRGIGVGSSSQVEWRTDGVCAHRGVFTLGPSRMVTGDPFGLYTVNLDVPEFQSLMVLPPIVPLPAIEVAPGGRAGEGRIRRSGIERTVSSAGIREYATGDSHHWIHWPISLHRNSLYVRLFESTPASDWWVILDMNKDSHQGIGESDTDENRITLAASLVDRGLRLGRSVGFLTHGTQPVWLPPRVGDQQRWNILQSMAQLSPGDIPLQGLLARMRPTLSHGASVIILSSDLSGVWVEEVLMTMRRGVVPTILLLEYEHSEASQPAIAQAIQERGKALQLVSLLNNLGMACYIIPPAIFASPEAAPGHLGEWNLKVLPTGKVVVVKPQKAEVWRPLS